MQIVIDISEKQYEIIKELVKKQNSVCPEADSAEKIILKGTPLPKGHGRLIDADVLCDYFWDNRSKLYTHKDLRIVIDNAPTIIEADKAESEDTEDEDILY